MSPMRRKSAPLERRRPTRQPLPSDAIRKLLDEVATGVRVLKADVDTLLQPPHNSPARKRDDED